MAKLKAVVLHPREWESYSKDFFEVKHVSIGGDTPKRLNGTPTWDGIGEVATEGGINNLIETVRKFKPDLFLMGIHFYLPPQILYTARQLCPEMKICMHYTDQRKGVPDEVKKYIGLLDLLLVTNNDKDDHKKYLDAGIPRVETFYDGINPLQYWPKPMEPSYDCFFGGNNHYALFEDIKESGRKPPAVLDFPRGYFRHEFLCYVNIHFNLLIRGRLGWDKLEGFNVKPMKFHPKFLSALREAKIVLGTAVAPRYGLVMRRVFRSIACQRMLVMEYVPGFENFFKNHKHFVWFKTVEEGIDVIRFYLDRDEVREKIARQGRNLLLERHTFHHRLIEFEKLVRRVF